MLGKVRFMKKDANIVGKVRFVKKFSQILRINIFSDVQQTVYSQKHSQSDAYAVVATNFQKM